MSSKDHNGARSTPLQLQVVEFPLHQLTPNPANPSAVSRFDDLSLLGRHRLICGSALEPTCFSQLRNGELATAIITDSPYNVRIGGHALRQIRQIARSISVFGLLIISRFLLAKWWPERRRPVWPTCLKLGQPS